MNHDDDDDYVVFILRSCAQYNEELIEFTDHNIRMRTLNTKLNWFALFRDTYIMFNHTFFSPWNRKRAHTYTFTHLICLVNVFIICIIIIISYLGVCVVCSVHALLANSLILHLFDVERKKRRDNVAPLLRLLIKFHSKIYMHVHCKNCTDTNKHIHTRARYDKLQTINIIWHLWKQNLYFKIKGC